MWTFRVHRTYYARCSAPDLFLTTISQLFVENPNYAEYGACLGETAFFPASLISLYGGNAILVDSFTQHYFYKLFDKENLIEQSCVFDNSKKLISLRMSFIGNNNFILYDKDIINDSPYINETAGVTFWDLHKKDSYIEAVALMNLMKQSVKNNQKNIYIIDDVVHERDGNKTFASFWKDWYKKEFSSIYKPYLVTDNRLFLSNFSVDKKFNDVIELLKKHEYLQEQQPSATSKHYGVTIVEKTEKSMEDISFMHDNAFWDELIEIFS